MTENLNLPKPIRNLLVLIAVIGLVLAGWLTGHILRHITPAYQHPPIQEIDPQIKTGYFIGPDGQFTIVGSVDGLEGQVFSGQAQFNLQAGCMGLTYFTSLPAKCLTPDGKLVRVGGIEANVIVIPKEK